LSRFITENLTRDSFVASRISLCAVFKDDFPVLTSMNLIFFITDQHLFRYRTPIRHEQVCQKEVSRFAIQRVFEVVTLLVKTPQNDLFIVNPQRFLHNQRINRLR
jgi:hypothetical protein